MSFENSTTVDAAKIFVAMKLHWIGGGWVLRRGVGTQIKVFCCNNYIIVLSVCPNVTECVIIFSLLSGSFSSCLLQSFVVLSLLSTPSLPPLSPPPPSSSFTNANRQDKISARVNTCMHVNNDAPAGGGCWSLCTRCEVFKTVYADSVHLMYRCRIRNGNGIFVSVFML